MFLRIAFSLFRRMVLTSFFAALVDAQNYVRHHNWNGRDPSGLAIPRAPIEATQLESGYKYQVQTNQAGVHPFADLRAGSYDLTFASSGLN
jgi:hypothetical protein